MYAADDKAANKSSILRFASSAIDWYWTACEEKAKSEKILWDTSARTSSRIMHMLGSHTPESVAFLDHLHQAEATAQVDVPGKFRLNYFDNHDEGLARTKRFMQSNGIDEYYDYMIALASSTKLTDREKIKKEFVIPFFKELCDKTEDEKEALFKGYCRKLDWTKSSHPINRLFLAAFCYTGIKLNKTIVPDQGSFAGWFIPWNFLENALEQDDTSSLEIYLQHGANPNRSTILSLPPFTQCQSFHAAQLLLQYGADICKQQQRAKPDLITNLCGDVIDNKFESRLLDLFLSYVPLDENNQFGLQWTYILQRSIPTTPYTTILEKLSILLKHECLYHPYYQQETIRKAIAYTDSGEKSEGQKRRQEVAALFKKDEERHKSITFSLQDRSRTGKFSPNTNFSSSYNRANIIAHSKRY